MQATEIAVPEAKDALKDILIKYAGWDNYEELRYYVDCAGVNPDRTALILKVWSNHRGTAVPLELFKKAKPEKAYESSIFGLYDDFTRRELQELMLVDTRMRIEERLERKNRLIHPTHQCFRRAYGSDKETTRWPAAVEAMRG